MSDLKCMVKRLAFKLQLTNILWCLMYVAGALVVLFDLYVWRP